MTSADARQRARDAWEQRAWAQARDALVELDRSDALDPPDLQRLAVASYLSGDDADSLRAWSRAYQALIGAGELPAAARCALWQAFQLFSGGETARGGGWLARAQRLLDECRHECAEHGFVQSLTALQLIRAGDPAGAQAAFAGAVRIGQRFGDSDVMSLGRLGQGQALFQLGQLDEGMALLDEVMVSVTSNEVSPLISGLAYCAMIGFCREIFDVRRAAEWTVALSNWCGTQPELVAYRGQCLIHRSELLQLRGEWPDAMVEARAARERLSQPSPHPALGSAWYQQAELHRLRGEFAEAEDAYREAVRWGNPPQPGFALLRLAQGRNDAARTVISRLLDDTSETSERSRLLPAFVEICLATSDVPRARAAADELGRIADERDAPYVTAMAAQAIGSVLLAEADLSAAYVSLSRAGEIWQELDVPYEGARARALVAQVCNELGDADSAELQLAAARAVFAEIGAAPDLARLDRASARTPVVSGGLTVRELEVLRQLASGQTNRAIAEQLVISEKTVARHVSNIFAKLGLSSRAAATAYAYENQLV